MSNNAIITIISGRLLKTANIKGFRGFTLAEVLITLVIIGVISSFVISPIIQKQRELKTVSTLTKHYSIISQAWLRMEQEYGPINTWGMSNTNTGMVDEDNNTILDESGPELIRDRLAKFLQVVSFHSDSIEGKPVYRLSGEVHDNNLRDPMMVLSDGSVVTIGWYTNGGVSLSLIIPPFNKITYGKNTFYLKGSANKVVPEGTPDTNGFQSQCFTMGRSCTAWIIYNKNLDYLHCSDLSWSGKKKC